MRIAVEISDELCRRAKAEAAWRGCSLQQLIEEGLRGMLASSPVHRGRRRSLAELMKKGRGIVDSGIPDLASSRKRLP